jgi:hypothetical protein
MTVKDKLVESTMHHVFFHNGKRWEHSGVSSEDHEDAREAANELKQEGRKVKVVKSNDHQDDVSRRLNNESVDEAASGQTKTAILADLLGRVSSMSHPNMVKFHNQVLQGIGDEADSIPDGAAAHNAATVAMKEAVREDVLAVFGGEDLAEETRTKIVDLFETALSASVAAARIELEERMEADFAERAEKDLEALAEAVDTLVQDLAAKWLEENRVAVDNSLKVDVTDQFMRGLRDLYVEHYIEVPEDKVDAVVEMAAENDKLRAQLDEAIADRAKMRRAIEEGVREEAVERVGSGLSANQLTQLGRLCEDLEFDADDLPAFEERVKIVRRQHFSETTRIPTGGKNSALNESTDGVDEDTPGVGQRAPANPNMNRYTAAISRGVHTYGRPPAR